MPDWSFKTFMARYPEIVTAAMEKAVQERGPSASGAVVPGRYERICPVCGRRLFGTLASCPGCGLD